MDNRNAQLRNYLDRKFMSMETERNSFLSHWQDIVDHIRPRSARIGITVDSSKGIKYNNKIIDSTATLASRTLRSGLMAGLTSPARPWFKLGTPDPSLMDWGPVKQWIYAVETKMREVFTKSNLYQVLPMMYGALGDFGTAAMAELEDDHSLVRFYYFQTGSFMISVNEYNRCDTLYRKFPKTVRQLVKEFGESNVSPTVMSMYKSQQTETEIEIIQAIEPNEDRDSFSYAAKDKPVRSVYYESGATQEKFLRQSGFDEFPIMAPRWDLWDNSSYGFSPGMDALGDVKALQLEQRRKAQAIDIHVRPPYIADGSLKGKRISTVPGDITFIDGLATQQHAGFRPAYTIQPEIQELLEDMQEIQARIKRCYFEDMMGMLANSDNPQMTAREIEERHSEKVLILGPVMERLNDELFDPLIERTFGIMLRKGQVPPIPKELQGQELKVEYTSILAQAQKLIGTANVEKVAQFVIGMGNIDPKAVDKFDVDEAIDTYAEMHGINPNIIRTLDQVKPIREIKQKQQQAAQMAQMAKPAEQMAKAGKAMGDTDGGNVQDMIRQMTGQQ